MCKTNNRKRSISTNKRSLYTTFHQENSENIHPNRLSNNSSYYESHDVGRSRTLGVSNSYCLSNNRTIQENDCSWYANQRPLSSISINPSHVPQIHCKRKQGETGSTIGSNPLQNMHTTINSISEEDPKFFRPFSNQIGLYSYQPFKPTDPIPAHKRYCNSLSTIVKDDTLHHDETLNQFDIR